MSTKTINFKDLKIENIEEKISELKKELILLKIKQKTQQKFTPHIIKKTKNQISQLLTLQTNYYHKQK